MLTGETSESTARPRPRRESASTLGSFLRHLPSFLGKQRPRTSAFCSRSAHDPMPIRPLSPNSSKRLAWPPLPTRTRGSCPAGCNSGCRWPAPSPFAHRCC
ncbi:UNVERIFIED_CONTAM: hypothetical protein GTU68_045365 [Idotea baltica]|nr:hypothetical protein [Idotea baltica]